MNNLKDSITLGKGLAYFVMLAFTLLTLVPLIWLFYSSFKPNGDIMRNMIALPKTLDLSNYARAWDLGNLGTYFINSILYSAIATLLTLALSLATGFGLAYFDYKVNKIFYAFFLGGVLISVHSVLLPLFILESKIQLTDTRLGIILPYIAFGLPMGIYLATAYIKGMPRSILESATIDGATHIQMYYYIITPYAKPVAATILILTFLQNWNEFVFVFILTSSERLKSLPVGINSFSSSLNMDFGMQFAALVIGTVPVLIFYAFFHRELAKGFADGAVKG